jgi:hypothetical protein
VLAVRPARRAAREGGNDQVPHVCGLQGFRKCADDLFLVRDFADTLGTATDTGPRTPRLQHANLLCCSARVLLCALPLHPQVLNSLLLNPGLLQCHPEDVSHWVCGRVVCSSLARPLFGSITVLLSTVSCIGGRAMGRMHARTQCMFECGACYAETRVTTFATLHTVQHIAELHIARTPWERTP